MLLVANKRTDPDPSSVPILFFALLILNVLIFQSPWLGLGSLAIGAWSVGRRYGTWLFPEESFTGKLLGGAFFCAALASILGSIVFYTTTITELTLLTIIACMTLFSLFLKNATRLQLSLAQFSSSPVTLAALLLTITSLGLWWHAILSSPITTAIRSPWLSFSPAHILLLAVAFATSWFIYRRETSRLLGAIGLVVTLFSAVSMAAALYSLGYGFDPFLHRATVEHIATFGTITPKPLYYIGQYALELLAMKLFFFPLFIVDIFLAPLAISLIGLFLLVQKKTTSWTPALLALLPLGAWISTTPQALAFAGTFAVIIWLWQTQGSWTRSARIGAWIIAIGTLTFHPLAGIPAVGLVFLREITAWKHNLAKPLFIVSTIGLSIALPIAFFAQSYLSGMSVGFSWSNLTDFSRLPDIGFWGTRWNAWGDVMTLVGANLFFITLILSLYGLIKIIKNDRDQFAWIYAAGIIIALTNFLFLGLAFDFPFLIAYERTDFAARLLIIAWLCCFPFVARAMQELAAQAAPWKNIKIFSALLILIIFISNIYTAYPRHDNYARSAAFSLTQADRDAVHAIDEDADTIPYIVLSNQTLAAAAIETFGFRTYYYDDVFFYPIPTGGPLYQKYLSMVEEVPTRETAQQAAELAGVHRVYFAVHSYWWQASKIIEEAKKSSDTWFSLGDGLVTIFVYSF